MPPFGLMIGSMLLQAVALYISRKENPNEKQNWNFLNLGSFLLYSTICGLLFYSAPEKLTRLNRSLALGLSTEDVVFGGFCILSVMHCILTSTVGVRYCGFVLSYLKFEINSFRFLLECWPHNNYLLTAFNAQFFC